MWLGLTETGGMLLFQTCNVLNFGLSFLYPLSSFFFFFWTKFHLVLVFFVLVLLFVWKAKDQETSVSLSKTFAAFIIFLWFRPKETLCGWRKVKIPKTPKLLWTQNVRDGQRRCANLAAKSGRGCVTMATPKWPWSDHLLHALLTFDIAENKCKVCRLRDMQQQQQIYISLFLFATFKKQKTKTKCIEVGYCFDITSWHMPLHW